MIETWIEIPDTSRRYSVSNFGRVRANWSDRPDRNLKHRVRFEKIHILKPSKHTTGYWRVGLGRNNQKYVHRLVAQAFLPNPNNFPQVDHIDGQRLNCHANNLQWVTAQENVILGGVRHGFSSQIAASKQRRVFVEYAQEFADLHKAGHSLRWIARKFGTDHKIVRSRIDQLGLG